MKNFILSLAITVFGYQAAADTPSRPDGPPEPYTLQQINEKFGVEIADGNYAPVVKAIIVWMNDIARKEEYNAQNVAEALKEMALRLPQPARSLVYTLVADLYATYWQTNRWQIRGRTSAPDAGGTIDTWDIQRLFREAAKYYRLAAEDADELKSTPLTDYEPILAVGTYHSFDSTLDYRNLLAISERYFPTLYDFVTFNTIRELSGRLGDVEFSGGFGPGNARYWDETAGFIALEIPEPDAPSNVYEILTMYQRLLAFALERFERDPNSANVLPLIVMDARRFAYLKERDGYGSPEKIYEQALIRLRDRYARFPESRYADYLLAIFYKERGDKSNSDADLKKAYALCEDVARNLPGLAPYARELQKEITSPRIGISVVRQEYPHKPFLALAQYRNVESLYINVFELEDEDELQSSRNWSKGWEWLGGRTPVRAAQVVKMPVHGDYLGHTAQFMADGLPQGHYLLVATAEPLPADWYVQKKNGEGIFIAAAELQVSPLTLNLRNGNGKIFRRPDGGSEMINQAYVADAFTGVPVKGARIDAYLNDYDTPRNMWGEYPRKLVGSQTTDADGMAYIPWDSLDNDSPKLIVTTRKDGRLAFDGRTYFYLYDREYDDEPTALFFTDRAIYRPGQTVYYKILLIREAEDGTKQIVPHHEIEMTLRDANYKILGEVALKTNEFGSAQGSFTIPQGGLNGYITLDTDYGEQHIRVEEYKRPTFEVKVDPVKQTYRYGDSVTVTGKAVALAGYAVDNSTVKYRIKRESNYRNPWRMVRNQNVHREILQGEVKTDHEGGFKIVFAATSEGLTNREIICNFTVDVDVTDPNGETRNASYSVSVSDNPLLLEAIIPPTIDNRKDFLYDVAATNLNGRSVAADVRVRVEELAGHDRVLRKRVWNSKPDTTLIALADFERFFPNDIYSDEDDPETYPVRRSVWESTLQTTPDSTAVKLNLDAMKDVPAGWYRITLDAETEDGFTRQRVVTVRLNGTPSGKPSPITKTDDWIACLKDSGEPGEEAVFLFAGPREKSIVRYDVFHKGSFVRSGRVKVGTTPQRLAFPIAEEHRGGFDVQFIMVSGGRTYGYNADITVPFADKRLKLSFTTFRDRLLPGEHERWTISVRNALGEKESAEMVATLYDASLDQFASLRWPYEDSFRPPQSSAPTRWYINTWDLLASARNSSSFRAMRFETPIVVLRRYDGWYTMLTRNDGKGKAILDALKVLDPSFKITGDNSLPNVKIQGSDANILAREKTSFTGAVTSLSGSELKEVRAGARALVGQEDGEIGIGERLVEHDVHKFTTLMIAPDKESIENIATRKNFNETAFFYPQLRTDENGDIAIEFTIPESLTRWNMRGFAHTKDLKTGSIINTLITQKQVAVSANAPRFLREGDTIRFTAKVNNITRENIEGEALLRLYDAATMQPIDGMIGSEVSVGFAAAAGQSAALDWVLTVPEGVAAVTYRLTARAGAHTDGEERTIPVMPNTILLTESKPFMVRAGESKTVEFERLRDNAESVKRNHSLTLEFTSNPAWYAVLSMPYLMEFPYECSEQIFSRFYANSLSSAIVAGSPGVKRVFEQWRGAPEGSKNALLSNLEKNQELKQVLLEETPWVMQAQDDAERRNRVGMLFDLNNMADGQRTAFDRLVKMQRGDGGFAWFDGLAPNRYITQHIAAGFGRLARLDALNDEYAAEAAGVIGKAFTYLDDDILRDYNAIKVKTHDVQYISYIQLHYLYAASFGRRVPQDGAQRAAFDFYYAQAKKYWRKFNVHGQGLAALAFHRYGDAALAREVVAELRKSASKTEDMGMFWRGNRRGYFWYEAPIETQALMIAVFDEAGGSAAEVEEMKVWLLRNKQTNDWQTTKATADACYALLMTGGNLLDQNRTLDVRVGGQPLDKDIKAEAGTGYVKTVWDGGAITPAMSRLDVANPNDSGTAWGALYWQYFEKLDNVTPAETDLRMEKQMFVKRNTPRGPELTPIGDGVEVGDLVTVRIILRAHRDYEFVHLKDMRASGLEPASALSGHRYRDGLGYYENIKDASTNFFITSLPAGTYVFEYDLRVNHAGDFSNGITTFQCMYAPEFTSHSEGTRLRAK